MTTDDVIAEVRAAREAYAARFGFDPVAMARDLREREAAGGRLIVLPPVPRDEPRSGLESTGFSAPAGRRIARFGIQRPEPTEALMPVYPLTLPATYRDQGFFNITVEFDGYVRRDEGPVELLLVAGGAELRVQARVNRTAQSNGTARVMGGTELRRWFQEHYIVGDRVDVEIRSPECMRIAAPAG